MQETTGSTDFPAMIRRAWLRLEAASNRSISRKEVAAWTGVTTSYISNLEAGRNKPSREVLRNLSVALAFTPEEMREVHNLFGYASADEQLRDYDPSQDQIYLDRLTPALAGVVDQHWNVVAMNAPYSETFPGLSEQGNILKWFFQDPRSKNVMVEWEQEAALTVSWLKSTAAVRPMDTSLHELYEELSHSQAFLNMYGKPGVTSGRVNPLMLVNVSGGVTVLSVRVFDHPDYVNLKIFIAARLA